eukprot:CAMPEP_0172645392 /NCGR_PEP_ID=MMETSP1068-20121228/239707_1 /TAXON_ID=35684 /ORGANISM="Pseudopedinella elastica, Strain CCMP716" /LENGTH=296 /DNA_ID=CAMNT_0013459629 /DNA_START=138 /DNA_END=1029 /DNA_ORIENTATION=-
MSQARAGPVAAGKRGGGRGPPDRGGLGRIPVGPPGPVSSASDFGQNPAGFPGPVPAVILGDLSRALAILQSVWDALLGPADNPPSGECTSRARLLVELSASHRERSKPVPSGFFWLSLLVGSLGARGGEPFGRNPAGSPGPVSSASDFGKNPAGFPGPVPAGILGDLSRALAVLQSVQDALLGPADTSPSSECTSHHQAHGSARAMVDSQGGKAHIEHCMGAKRRESYKRAHFHAEDAVGSSLLWLDLVSGFHNPADVLTKQPEVVSEFQAQSGVLCGSAPHLYESAAVPKVLSTT